jgi:hypothetical protein
MQTFEALALEFGRQVKFTQDANNQALNKVADRLSAIQITRAARAVAIMDRLHEANMEMVNAAAKQRAALEDWQNLEMEVEQSTSELQTDILVLRKQNEPTPKTRLRAVGSE